MLVARGRGFGWGRARGGGGGDARGGAALVYREIVLGNPPRPTSRRCIQIAILQPDNPFCFAQPLHVCVVVVTGAACIDTRRTAQSTAWLYNVHCDLD